MAVGFSDLVEQLPCSVSRVQAQTPTSGVGGVAEHLGSPGPRIIKLNVDVALPEYADFIRVAMVARDARGVTIWWARREVVVHPQPSEGEAIAVVFGVNQAIQQGWERVTIETDCLPVHFYLLSRTSGGDFIPDACFVSSIYFRSLLFSFVGRLGNSHAPAIATAM